MLGYYKNIFQIHERQSAGGFFIPFKASGQIVSQQIFMALAPFYLKDKMNFTHTFLFKLL